MYKKLFSTKILIETKNTTLSPDNVWISEYTSWRELWASISIKYISSRSTLYLFAVRWKRDFPKNFRVRVNNQVFVPTQPPIQDLQTDFVLFHAKLIG
jgi:head-tail adaptor